MMLDVMEVPMKVRIRYESKRVGKETEIEQIPEESSHLFFSRGIRNILQSFHF